MISQSQTAYSGYPACLLLQLVTIDIHLAYYAWILRAPSQHQMPGSCMERTHKVSVSNSLVPQLVTICILHGILQAPSQHQMPRSCTGRARKPRPRGRRHASKPPSPTQGHLWCQRGMCWGTMVGTSRIVHRAARACPERPCGWWTSQGFSWGRISGLQVSAALF